MDFTMHASRKPDMCIYPRILFTVLLFTSSVPVSGNEYPVGIWIQNVHSTMTDQTISLNADILYQLSDESRKALEHGVPLVFDIEIRIKEVRNWMWDKLVAKKMLRYRVEHQPLTGQYLVSDNYRGRHQQFTSLPGALEFIGKLENFPLMDTVSLSREHKYVAQIKSVLDVQSLPAPLRPLAYLSTDWRLSSSWHNLEIGI